MEKIYFISDTHFKYDKNIEGEAEKRKAFIEFLSHCNGAQSIFLLGDIFDFWFEYHGTIPRYYQDILFQLKKLRENGTNLYFSRGNHDYWLGRYIREDIGIEVLPDIVTLKLQGKTVTLTHGDNLLRSDYGYRLLKSVIRNRGVIAIAKLIHPELLFSFAKLFSRTSKGITHRRTEKIAMKLIEEAQSRFFRWNNDIFIMGHIHYPVYKKFGNKEFVILGDWEENFSYLEMENGTISLKYYLPGKNTLIENL